MTELTINASSFKARCLEIMDQLAARKLTRVTITKRGKPVSVMQPPPDTPAPRSIIGCFPKARLSDAELAELDLEATGLTTEFYTDSRAAELEARLLNRS